jgi:hypothetical protein
MIELEPVVAVQLLTAVSHTSSCFFENALLEAIASGPRYDSSEEPASALFGEPRTSIDFHYLGARRVTYQVQVSGGGFVLAQVDIDGHMAPVIRWGRAHEDGRAAGNFSDEPGEANPRREGRERWNLSFQNLLRAGVRPTRAVADMARGFHDMLTNAVGRFPYRNLILFCTGYVRQLFEVGDEGANFCLAHGWRQHVLSPNVEPLQQHNLGFLSHGGYI